MSATRHPDAIAIVGIGARFAKADDLQAFWRMTVEGQDAFTGVPPDRWDHDAFYDDNPRSRDKSYAPRAAFIDDVRSFPALTLQVPPRRVEVMDPQQRLSLEICLQAIEDSGRVPADLPRRTGVYMGVTAMEYRSLSTVRIAAQMMATGQFGEAPEDPEVLARAVENVIPCRPFSAPGLLSNMVAAAVCQELRLHGPAYTTDAACASALVALHAAIESLRTGSIDAALAGGVYLCLTPEHHVAFSRIGAISRQGMCLPFDSRADGFVEGDGCGVVLLKRHADALRDGDRIYAVIDGIGMNNDGGGTGPMAPVPAGQVEILREAWGNAERAGVDLRHLGYIEAHGTGTSVGDKIEFDGLNAVLGAGAERAALGSSKANFGHTMSAAGIAGLIRAALAVHHKTIPPMANFETPKDTIELDKSPFYIPTVAEAWDADERVACVSSFGFGGTNVHAVLRNAALAEVPADQAELVLISAPDEVTLRDLAGRTGRAMADDAQATVAGLARLWATRRKQPARCGVVATSKADLIDKLAAIGRGEYPKGAVFGTVSPDGDAPKIAFMYPGQGAQRLGMIAGIRDRFPVVAEALDAVDGALDDVTDRPITHYLYPERRAEAIAEDAAFAELTDTKQCQPALFAVGIAMTRLLEQVGVTPTVVAGHSVGEFTAAAAGGVVSVAEGARWVARRGAAMSAMTGDNGAMAAIVADRETVEGMLVPGAVIANVNHPRQMVISGSADAVENVAQKAEAAELKTVRLSVSHGFHSQVFDGLDLTDVIDAIPLADPTVPVASCIQAHPYADADEARAVFKAHAISPVVWTETMRQCQELGADIYLQVGAGGPLVSFARGALPKGQLGILPLAGKDDADGGASLLEGLAQLWVRGVDVDVRPITADAALPSVPPIVLPRETYWIIDTRKSNRPKLATGSGSAVADASAEPAPSERTVAPTPAGGGIGEIVFAAVARASAYPRDALRPGMRLGDDLGFDSMMVADLAEELGKAIAGFQGIPQEILINEPTIQDIIDFAESPEATAGADADDDAPLARYAPRWVPARLPSDGQRALPGGRLLAVGDIDEPLVAALVADGYERVADGAADLVLYGAPTGAPVPVSAVLAGEAEAQDLAGDLIAVLDAQAGLGQRPDVVLLRRPDDPWSAALSGVIRCVAREWPEMWVKAIETPTRDAAIVTAELMTRDRAVDVRLVDGVRHILGTEPLPQAAPWSPADGDRVLITGGTRGIGRDLGLALADAGAQVVLLGRSAPPEGAPNHDNITYVQGDVTRLDSLQAAVAGVGPITTLVHSAGVLADGPLGQVDAEEGQLARDVKVLGFLNAVRACGSSLTAALGLGSWAGRFGNAAQAHYGAANALMAEIAAALPARIRGAVVEFGPWTNSEMVQSIPKAMQQTMRAQGVDFVGDDAGQAALLEDLGEGRGIIVRGRQVPSVVRRTTVTETLATDTHPFLLDHAIAGTPVLPLASAATMMADAAGLTAPFEVRDLTLFQGVTVNEPLDIQVVVSGDRAEVRQGAKGTLSYRATLVAEPGDIEVSGPRTGGEAPTLALDAFYRDVTFHGPLLQGIVEITGVGADFIQGRVQTGRPTDWIPATTQAAWGIDPLAFDSAMQLTAYVAWTRFGRAGTPVGFDRFVQRSPWPQGEALDIEAIFGEGDEDRFSATITFRTADGEVVARAENVVAQMQASQASQAKAAANDDAAPEVTAPTFELKPEYTDVEAWPAYKDLAFRLQAVEAMGLHNPYFDLHEGTARDTTQIAGREVINYSSYNYVGLSGDERVLDAVDKAMRKYGTSVSASRVASGERPFHRELEAALAAGQGVEDAVCMAGGHATNVNTIGHLFGPNDLILHDELIHDSCIQGIKLSGAARRSFSHEDLDDLEGQLKGLRGHYEKVLILVEGVYSMDGDIANLPGYLALKKRYGCMLMVDEAHSFGTIGHSGLGIGQHYKDLGHDIDLLDVDLWMGTMSKSLASMGGWIAGKKALITYLRYTTPGFVFAAGIPPTLGVAALTSLKIWQEETWRVEQLQKNCKMFYELLNARGLDTGPSKGESPVIPVITGDSMHAMQLSQRLLEQGINAKPIIFPAVANDAARLRFFMTALHTEEQLRYTVNCIADTLAEIRQKKPKPKR